jgi:hypothetical protein
MTGRLLYYYESNKRKPTTGSEDSDSESPLASRTPHHSSRKTRPQTHATHRPVTRRPCLSRREASTWGSSALPVAVSESRSSLERASDRVWVGREAAECHCKPLNNLGHPDVALRGCREGVGPGRLWWRVTPCVGGGELEGPKTAHQQTRPGTHATHRPVTRRPCLT